MIGSKSPFLKMDTKCYITPPHCRGASICRHIYSNKLSCRGIICSINVKHKNNIGKLCLASQQLKRAKPMTTFAFSSFSIFSITNRTWPEDLHAYFARSDGNFSFRCEIVTKREILPQQRRIFCCAFSINLKRRIKNYHL